MIQYRVFKAASVIAALLTAVPIAGCRTSGSHAETPEDVSCPIVRRLVTVGISTQPMEESLCLLRRLAPARIGRHFCENETEELQLRLLGARKTCGLPEDLSVEVVAAADPNQPDAVWITVHVGEKAVAEDQ